MNKLQQAEAYIPVSRKKFREQCIAAGGTKADADEMYRQAKHEETWVNEKYVVMIRRDANHGFGDSLPGGMFELSVRRQDRGTDIDWREIQAIKNQIVGEENEMVELYPAESRKRDAANQFWFYGFNDPTVRFPFGMFGRVVNDGPEIGNSKQRKLD